MFVEFAHDAWRRSASVAFLTLVSFVLAASSGATGGPAGPLSNPGFEDSPAGSPPAGWKITAAADAVRVVGTEGPDQFAVYAEQSLTVAPYRGSQALRLGTPRMESQSQTKGRNTISQRFTPAAPELRFALRLFSFEHRGHDKVKVEVDDGRRTRFAVSNGAGQPFAFAGLSGATCSKTPCELEIDVGSSGTFFGSGWTELVMHGLPTDRAVTLTVTLDTSKSNSHPSWLYLDGEVSNAKPTAVIDYSPGREPGTVALEGDFVAFNCGESSDPDGDELTCRWRATGSTIPVLTAEGPLAFFVFPEDGIVTMELTVSDGELTDTVTTPVVIDNGAPLISALHLEVPEGGQGTAICRFLDPGVEDTHGVSITVAGNALEVLVQQENTPSLSSGFGRGVFDAAGLAPGSYQGECTVEDDDGGVTVQPFDVAVLTQAAIAAREQADTDSSAGAPTVVAGRTFLTALEHPGDIDVFQIVTPDGLPPNSEINVTVDVPDDYDAILLSRGAGTSVNAPFVSAPFVSAPFVNAPFVNVPFVNVPFVNAPFVNAPFVNVPFVNAPFVNVPFVNAPFVNAPLETSPFVSAGFQFKNFPLSQVGLASPDGSQISGADVGLSELGLGALQSEPLLVKAVSAELGTGSEHMLVKVGPGEQTVYLALVASASTVSAAPASISVEVSIPPSPQQTSGANCAGTELVPAGKTTQTVVLHPQGDPLTVIVTQRERFSATCRACCTTPLPREGRLPAPADLARGLGAGPAGLDATLGIAAALWFYWYQRGLLTEGRDWLARALAAGDANPALRARAYLGLSSLARQQNDHEDAERHCAGALAIYRDLADREGTAVALSQLGAIVQRRGEFERAADLLSEALVVLREIGNRERVAFTLLALGVVQHLRGDLDAAAGHYRESLEIARGLEDRNAIATALVNLGEVAQLRGDTADAARHYRESLTLYAGLGLRNAIAHCLEVLASIDAIEGRPAEAASLFGAADRIREEIGTPVEAFNVDRVRGDLDRIEEDLGHHRFEAEWTKGRNLELREAVELAMRDFV